MVALARIRAVITLVAVALTPVHARAADPSSLFFFGDSLTDEGRAGRSAPVMWAAVLRDDLSISAGANLAVAGATTRDQPGAPSGDTSFLGQVHAFLASGPAIPPGGEAAVWIGTNDVWTGVARGEDPNHLAADASSTITAGLEALARAGLHRVVLLGVYDLSLTNAFAFVDADTPAVRAAAAAASKSLNDRLERLRVPGVAITFFNMAGFIDHLQADAKSLGFLQTLPLRPGATCDAACQQTSVFDDAIHLSSRTQALIGDYVANGDPVFNDEPIRYGATAPAAADR